MNYDKDIMDAYLKDEDTSMMDTETFEIYKNEIAGTYGYSMFQLVFRLKELKKALLNINLN